MTRSIDKAVLVAGVVVVLVVVIWQIAGVVSVNQDLREKHAMTTRFAERVNANDLPPPMKNPTTQSGRVLHAWETLPAATHTLGQADFFAPTSGTGGR